MAQVSEQLVNDHASLGEVLKQLQTALRGSDLEFAHSKLDLFWARLAVHIRAEHLHLFPVVLSGLENSARNASAPSLDEAQKVVAELRRDHDFFMHELARAVEIMREMSMVSDQHVRQEGLNNVSNIVLAVEQRLAKHNEVEERQIYRWATTVLSFEEQANLLNQITTELEKRPARFPLNKWVDE
jgi:hypothetical protein